MYELKIVLPSGIGGSANTVTHQSTVGFRADPLGDNYWRFRDEAQGTPWEYMSKIVRYEVVKKDNEVN